VNSAGHPFASLLPLPQEERTVIKLLAAISTLLVGAFFIVGLSIVQDKSKIQELERSPHRGKLSWHSQMAKAKGEESVLLRSDIVNYAIPRNLEDALANYHLVLAEPVFSRSYATTYDIQTWYKFRLIEELSAPSTNCTDCAISSDVPADLLPVQPDEFLSVKVGGEALVDGIKITSSDPTFPNFEAGRRYLLLVAFDSNKILGALRSGPWGAFAVKSDESFEPVNANLKHPFREKLSKDLRGSLRNLRNSLRTKK
jgi:hypothetical protein